MIVYRRTDTSSSSCRRRSTWTRTWSCWRRNPCAACRTRTCTTWQRRGYWTWSRRSPATRTAQKKEEKIVRFFPVRYIKRQSTTKAPTFRANLTRSNSNLWTLDRWHKLVTKVTALRHTHTSSDQSQVELETWPLSRERRVERAQAWWQHKCLASHTYRGPGALETANK